MASLWTPNLSQNFYAAVESLLSLTQNPLEEEAYSTALANAESTGYTLRLKDELQLADHIAFLAHSSEGVHAVSAACVEEWDSELLIRLASNQTPPEATVSGLREIIRTFSEGIQHGVPSHSLQDQLFESVLDLSQNRILQRIRPRWVPCPPYFRVPEEPLWVRIERLLCRLQAQRTLTPYEAILSRLDAFISSARLLDNELHGRRLRETIASVIRCCAKVSYVGDYGSLEAQLKDNYGTHFVSETREVLQIDKLARYLGLCGDLARLSRRRTLRSIGTTITLEPLAAFEAERPTGASQLCHVHAEIQLILFYEQNPLARPPRAIGCSKGACFLCDMMIQKLGDYHISFSHKRVYSKWSVPNVTWMSAERNMYFRRILQTMVDDICRLSRSLRAGDIRQLRSRMFGLESRAVLPLTSTSSLGSGLEVAKLSQPSRMTSKTTAPTGCRPASLGSGAMARTNPPAASNSKIAVVDLDPALVSLSQPSVRCVDKGNLPYQQQLGSRMVIHLDLGQLCLILEFPSRSVGILFVRIVGEKEASKGKNQVQRVEVRDVPTADMTLGCADNGSPNTSLWLQMDDGAVVEIKVAW